MPTRWGIIGATPICQDFVKVISKFPRDEHVLLGITAIEDFKAQQLAEQYKIQHVYQNYEMLAKDNHIDVVFVGCQLPDHHKVVILMFIHKKHVVCCKPLGMNLQETTEMVAMAKQYHLLLMEGIGTRCLPSYEFLRKELKSGVIGVPLQVIANIGLPISPMDHANYKEFGGGTILDLGVYALQLMLLALGPSPYEVIALGSLTEEGVDENTGAIIRYGDGKIAIISTHSKGLLPNEAFIIGTKGMIKLPEPFWNPTVVKIGERSQKFALLEEDSHSSNIHRHSIGLKYLAIEARKCLCAGLMESTLITHQESLILANLEDRLRKQIGVVYQSDQKRPTSKNSQKKETPKEKKL